MVVGVIVLVSVNVLIVYLPAYGAEIGLSVQVVGILLAARAAASMTSRLLLGVLRGRMTRQRLLVLCMVIPAIALSIVPLSSAAPILLGLMVLIGFGLGLGQPLTLSWVAMRAPSGHRGTALAVRMTGARLGQVIVPGLAGAVAVATGAGGVFLALGLVLGGSAVLVGLGSTFSEPSDEVP
jgi:MFS family permease